MADALFTELKEDCSAPNIICQSTKRIIHALKYYENLDIIHNKNETNKLIEFCNQTYKSLLDDYIHLINQHNDILEDLQNYAFKHCKFESCDVMKCKLCVRHHRNRNIDQINDEWNNQEYEFAFYRDLFDSIHCYLLHSFDIGLRITKKHKNKITQHTNNKNSCFDGSFANIKKIILEKKSKLKQNCEFSRFESDKFSIKNTEQNRTKTEPIFIDRLIDYMTITGISDEELIAIENFLNNEEYDTDSIIQDIVISEDATKSNIASSFQDEKHYKLVQQYIGDIHIRSKSFSIGYIFYYWDFYKNKSEHNDHYKNRNDYSGYSQNELYIPLKYKSLKEEILNNKLHALNMVEFQISITKADKYIDCKRVKETILKDKCIEQELHYGIEQFSKLSYSQLLSLILYCDWTDLCRVFSSTFRQTKPFETISQIKCRNQEYGNWSKALREGVQYFGSKGFKHNDLDEILLKVYGKKCDKVRGPFFCGMSFVMAIPEYNIRLCGPTSTSRQVEVATRFAGDQGIIIQLNNDGYYLSHDIRCFQCGWLSNYNGEDECLFFGGDRRIKIESIRNIATCDNFDIYMGPLYYFDCMLNGTDMDTDHIPDITDQHYVILDNLIKHKLRRDGFVNQFPKYINDMFDAFCSHKIQLIINLRFMDLFFSKISDLVLYGLSRTFDYNEQQKEKIQKKVDMDKINLLKEDILFSLFRNVNHIIIYTTNINGQKEYKINLLSMLSILEKPSIYIRDDITISIKATHKYRLMHIKSSKYDTSWLNHLWDETNEFLLAQHFIKWDVSLIQNPDGGPFNLLQDSLTIKKSCC